MAPREINLGEIIVEYIKTKEYFRDKKADLNAIQIQTCDTKGVKLHNQVDFKNVKKAHIPKKVILFETEIEPNVGNPKIKFETKCKSITSASVDIEQGLMYGEDLKVPLTIPAEIEQHMRGHDGFSKEIHLHQSRQTQLTEVLTWNISAEIEAQSGVNQLFTVELQECEYTADFSGYTTLGGTVFAVYSDPKGKKTYFGSPKSLREIIQYLKEKVTHNVVDDNIKNMLHEIKMTDKGDYYYNIAGKCTFKYGLRTKVKTDEI